MSSVKKILLISFLFLILIVVVVSYTDFDFNREDVGFVSGAYSYEFEGEEDCEKSESLCDFNIGDVG